MVVLVVVVVIVLVVDVVVVDVVVVDVDVVGEGAGHPTLTPISNTATNRSKIHLFFTLTPFGKYLLLVLEAYYYFNYGRHNSYCQ